MPDCKLLLCLLRWSWSPGDGVSMLTDQGWASEVPLRCSGLQRAAVWPENQECALPSKCHSSDAQLKPRWWQAKVWVLFHFHPFPFYTQLWNGFCVYSGFWSQSTLGNVQGRSKNSPLSEMEWLREQWLCQGCWFSSPWLEPASLSGVLSSVVMLHCCGKQSLWYCKAGSSHVPQEQSFNPRVLIFSLCSAAFWE